METLPARLQVRLGNAALPDCREYAPLIWGDGANYDSDGDAENLGDPTHWTFLELEHRETGERLVIEPLLNPEDPEPSCPKEVFILSIKGDNARSVALAAHLTALRTGASSSTRKRPMKYRWKQNTNND